MTASGMSLNGLSVHGLADNISDKLWHDRLYRWIEEGKSFSIHVAIFSQPFLEYVLAGTKTVDSRFSTNRIAPYENVDSGDVILIKQTGGPIVGICSAEQAWFYELDAEILRTIKDKFGKLICANEEFWRSRRAKSYGTLIVLKDVRTITPFVIDKKDRRGWVTVKSIKSKPMVVAFAGPIGSGKTTISQTLAKELHCQHVSFGDHFRNIAALSGNNSSDRTLLQRLGEEHVRLSPDQVCHDLLTNADWRPSDGTIVIDGVRHFEILNALKQSVAPLSIFLVYVQRDKIRTDSLSKQVGKKTMELFDSHSTEIQTDILRSSANVVVSAESKPATVVGRILKQLEEPRKP